MVLSRPLFAGLFLVCILVVRHEILFCVGHVNSNRYQLTTKRRYSSASLNSGVSWAAIAQKSNLRSAARGGAYRPWRGYSWPDIREWYRQLFFGLRIGNTEVTVGALLASPRSASIKSSPRPKPPRHEDAASGRLASVVLAHRGAAVRRLCCELGGGRRRRAA